MRIIIILGGYTGLIPYYRILASPKFFTKYKPMPFTAFWQVPKLKASHSSEIIVTSPAH
jgi:hypothetical protein